MPTAEPRGQDQDGWQTGDIWCTQSLHSSQGKENNRYLLEQLIERLAGGCALARLLFFMPGKILASEPRGWQHSFAHITGFLSLTVKKIRVATSAASDLRVSPFQDWAMSLLDFPAPGLRAGLRAGPICLPCKDSCHTACLRSGLFSRSAPSHLWCHQNLKVVHLAARASVLMPIFAVLVPKYRPLGLFPMAF